MHATFTHFLTVGYFIQRVIAFYKGLELNFVYGALTCSSAALGLLLGTRDYNLMPLALQAAVSKIK